MSNTLTPTPYPSTLNSPVTDTAARPLHTATVVPTEDPITPAVQPVSEPQPAESAVETDPVETDPVETPAAAAESATAPRRDLSYRERLVKWPALQLLHDALMVQLVGRVEIQERRLFLKVLVDGRYLGGIEGQRQGLMIRSPLPFAAAQAAVPALAERMVDVTGKGRWAAGVTEVRITQLTDISDAVALLFAATAPPAAHSGN